MYKVEFTRIAEKAFDNLMHSQPEIGKRVAKCIDLLKTDPYIGIPLKGLLKGCFKYRVSNYRIIYQIYKKLLKIIILDIGHRKDVYR